jgi:cobalamin biosynthesis protein CobT
VCTAIEREGKVDLLGIGLLSEDVKEYYRKWAIVRKSSDINHTLLSVLTKSVLV